MVIQRSSIEGLNMITEDTTQGELVPEEEQDMTIDDIVQEELAPPMDWVDTPEQAQLRACVMGILVNHECAEALGVGHALITLMRDQLSGGVANVRRKAALRARGTMSPAQIAEASGQSRQTIARLLVEARASS
jgi:hypothetical protein